MQIVLWLLGNRWFQLAALLVALAVQAALLNSANHSLRDARAALRNPATRQTWQHDYELASRNLTTCRGNTQVLSSMLDAQNRSLEAVARAAATRAAAANAAARAAQITARRAGETQAQAILAARAGADRCQSAVALMREHPQ